MFEINISFILQLYFGIICQVFSSILNRSIIASLMYELVQLIVLQNQNFFEIFRQHLNDSIEFLRFKQQQITNVPSGALQRNSRFQVNFNDFLITQKFSNFQRENSFIFKRKMGNFSHNFCHPRSQNFLIFVYNFKLNLMSYPYFF